MFYRIKCLIIGLKLVYYSLYNIFGSLDFMMPFFPGKKDKITDFDDKSMKYPIYIATNTSGLFQFG